MTPAQLALPSAWSQCRGPGSPEGGGDTMASTQTRIGSTRRQIGATNLCSMRVQMTKDTPQHIHTTRVLSGYCPLHTVPGASRQLVTCQQLFAEGLLCPMLF